jgi:hypothetical protein
MTRAVSAVEVGGTQLASAVREGNASRITQEPLFGTPLVPHVVFGLVAIHPGGVNQGGSAVPQLADTFPVSEEIPVVVASNG